MGEVYILICMTILASPFVGSFGATAVLRSMERRSFLFGRSYCDGCGKQLNALETLPIISRLAQRGRSSCCGANISAFYSIIEAAFLVVAIWAALLSNDIPFLPTVFLGWVLVLLAAYDFHYFILPNALTIMLMAGGLLHANAEGAGAFAERAIGSAVGASFMLAIGLAYRVLRGREGLGLGDVKLFGAAGAWVKLEGLSYVLFVASALGVVYVLIFLRGRSPDISSEKAPFGVFLAAALWLTWSCGPWLFESLL